MILPSMTYKEMYDNLDKDMSKVRIRINKILPKVIKIFKKTHIFPAMYTDEYQIPSTNNTYITFYYAGNINDCEKPHYTAFGIIFVEHQRFVLYAIQMGYKHTPKCESVMLPQLHLYTSHFLQRYNERCLHNSNLTPNKIAGLYLLRNIHHMVPIEINEKINKNIDKHGDYNKHGVHVPDGFCFTKAALQYKPSDDGIKEHDEVFAVMYLYTTFVSNSELSDTQKEAIDKEHWDILRQCIDSKEDGAS